MEDYERACQGDTWVEGDLDHGALRGPLAFRLRNTVWALIRSPGDI
jgi:hypothetical protein